MSKAAVFLADGFEEIEGLTVVDILRRAGVDTTMVSIKDTKEICGSHHITLTADRTFAECDFSDTDLLVLPGGMPGTIHLGEHEGLAALIREFVASGKKIAAICAAPTVFGKMGLLDGKNACCYPGMEGQLIGSKVSYEGVTVDGNIITARGMGVAIDFALKLTEILCGGEKADALSKSIVYK